MAARGVGRGVVAILDAAPRVRPRAVVRPGVGRLDADRGVLETRAPDGGAGNAEDEDE
jgi:hypothetical protein